MTLDPAKIRPHYRAFVRDERILLTGHSHQAWPDVSREALLTSWTDAAEHVDDKWRLAFEVADVVRSAIACRIGSERDQIALGASTHELVSRFLSALDLQQRPHLVTTSGEFHSLRRQLVRIAEAGVEVEIVPWAPARTLSARLARAIRPNTAAVLASTVLFETATIVPDLPHVVEAAHQNGAAVLLDAYHAFGVVPFKVAELGPDPIFVTAGGYKYAQWGEGNCFLRVPPDTTLRPIYTGWFSDFSSLEKTHATLGYGTRPADRFAGATYDPASHYRARGVIELFDREGWTVPRLRELSIAQTRRLIEKLDDFDIITPKDDVSRAGFVALRMPRATEVVARLRERGVFADSRGEILRLGPAPYVTFEEIDRATAILRTASAG